MRPTNTREKLIRSNEVIDVQGKDVVAKQLVDSRTTKKFSFDRAFGMDSQQVSETIPTRTPDHERECYRSVIW